MLSATHARWIAPVLGTIDGMVTNAATGLGVRHVEVDLYAQNGRLAGRTFTDSAGHYQFYVRNPSAYVVHQVTPRGATQITPQIGTVEPEGGYLPGYGSGSYNYGTNTDPSLGPVGPAGWKNITTGGSDPFQSPINITTPAVNLFRFATANFQPTVPSKIVNNGHQLQVQFAAGNANTLNVGGTPFTLKQFHFHDPSETTVHGRRYALEAHFVTESDAGAEAVLGVFFKVGAHNPALDPILAAAGALTTAGSSTTITDPVNLMGLLPTNPRGWYYAGSLTTPPLSLPVSWFVLATPITLDAQQLAAYEAIASGSGFLPNARPTQPLDGRRLNEVDYNVHFTTASVSGLDFVLAPRTMMG